MGREVTVQYKVDNQTFEVPLTSVKDNPDDAIFDIITRFSLHLTRELRIIKVTECPKNHHRSE